MLPTAVMIWVLILLACELAKDPYSTRIMQRRDGVRLLDLARVSSKRE